MLKTAGYRRRDLYALFGLEAALLGLCGGMAGAALGVAVSWAIKSLIETQNAIDVIVSLPDPPRYVDDRIWLPSGDSLVTNPSPAPTWQASHVRA